MIQATLCVAVFPLDVEHKEEDGGDAVKTEVRFHPSLCLCFLADETFGLQVSFRDKYPFLSQTLNPACVYHHDCGAD